MKFSKNKKGILNRNILFGFVFVIVLAILVVFAFTPVVNADPIVIGTGGETSCGGWERTHHQGNYDKSNGIAIDTTYVYVNGKIDGAAGGGSDMQTYRYWASSGATNWGDQEDDAPYDSGKDVAVKDGNAYVINSEASRLYRYNSAGALVWDVSLTLNGETLRPQGIAMASNALYIAGLFSTTDGDDMFVRKYDLNGNEIWTKTYLGIWSDAAYDVAVDSNGNVYIAGFTELDPVAPDVPSVVIKYDSNGNFIWQRNININDQIYSIANGIAVDFSTNDIYVTGYYEGFNTNGEDIYLTKLTSSGTEVWTRTYDGPGSSGSGADDRGNRVAVDPTTKNIYVIGFNHDSGSIEDMNVITLKYLPDGTFVGGRAFGTDGSDEGRDIVVLGTSTYMTGYLEGPSGEGQNMWTRKDCDINTPARWFAIGTGQGV